MKELTPERRKKVAEDITAMRAAWRSVREDQQYYAKLDRPTDIYLSRLRGLSATLNYVKSLPNKNVVDLGAGSARAIGQIAKSSYGDSLKFSATDIILDPSMIENIGRGNARITSAEVMRGFKPSSVGCFISVYGPFEQSSNRDVVLDKADQLLIPKGIMKFCIQREAQAKNPLKLALDLRYQHTASEIENFFRQKGYGLATKVVDFGKRGKNMTFLIIKPDDESTNLDESALSIMTEDFHNMGAMRRSLERQ